jgi:hypothetical protein
MKEEMYMKKTLPILLLLAMLLQACSESTAVPPPATAAPVATAGETVPSPDVAPLMPPTPTPQAVIEPVNHVMIPSTGTSDRATAHDNENSLFYDTKKVKTGDEFYKNRFERPFTSVDMAYLPDLDIVNFSITSDVNFFYVNISMVGPDPAAQSLTGYYGVEIDRNADGRAEVLLTTRPAYSTGFTADNIAVYLDVNGDVGGDNINRPDDFPSNGFETTVFDLSRGIYPEGNSDLAWVRQTTDGTLPAVEIAFARSMFKDGAEAFMWSVLSSDAAIDPARLYYNDSFTPEQAGAANTDDLNYPIKELAAMDNTCRVPLGFQAVGTEPLGCFVKGGETEAKATPVADGPNSTCALFPSLCVGVK